MDKYSYFHAQNILWSFVLTHNSTCSHHVLTAGSLQSMFIYTLCTIFNLSLSFISLFSFSSTCSSFSITSYHSHDLIAFSRGTFFIFWHQNGLCNAFSISLPPPPFWIFCQQASSPAPLLTQYLSLKLTMISFPCSVWSLYHCLL